MLNVMLKTDGCIRVIRVKLLIPNCLKTHALYNSSVKLHASGPSGVNTITGYGEGYVVVNGERRASSVVVLPDRIEQWEIGRASCRERVGVTEGEGAVEQRENNSERTGSTRGGPRGRK